MLLLIPLVISSLARVESVMIRSDRNNNWGNWGELEQCPSGSFVKAINVKVEEDQYKGDDTAMNAVHLYCVSLNDQVTTSSFAATKVLRSAEGPWGDFVGVDICYRGVAVGFQLRTEDWQRDGDDTATNDMVLICSNSNGEEKTTAKGQGWGTWGSDKKCPPRTAVCGLKTQVETPQGKGDDTALNNVDLMCCELPNPATECHPTDDWHEILRRDNTRGTSPIKYAVREKVGVQRTLLTTRSSSVLDEIALSVGFGVSYNVPGALGINFETKLATSKKTEHRWSRSETDVFSIEREEITEITIPSGCDTTLYQIDGKCGPYVVHSNVIRRVDKCLDDKRIAHKNILM